MPKVTRIDPGTRGIPSTGKSDAPIVQLASRFPFQSYFDTTLLNRAILKAPQGEQIIPSTKRSEALAGYAVGLHPSSQTPVAVQFMKGSQATDSGVLILKPGQIVRPNGEQANSDGRFSGIQWGLPFGWLGGGNATIVIFRTADTKVKWLDRSEVIFHRQRVAIVAPAAVPATANLRPNWPIAFPWDAAIFGSNAIPQQGNPILSVKPTRIAMELRGDLAAPATMRMYFIGENAFTTDDEGNEDLTVAPPAYDVTWGTWASVASAQYATQYQFQFLPVEAFRMSSINGQTVFVDVTGTLAGMFVDVVRYGEL